MKQQLESQDSHLCAKFLLNLRSIQSSWMLFQLVQIEIWKKKVSMK